MRKSDDDSLTVAQVTDHSATAQPQPGTLATAPPTDLAETAPEQGSTALITRCNFVALDALSTPDAQAALRESVTAVLTKSGDPYALATASMIWMGVGVDPAERLVRLESAIDSAPNDPMLRFLAYDLCRSRSEAGANRACDDSRSRRKLLDWLERDAGNASAWATLAIREFEVDAQAAGIAALSKAASSASATHYLLDTVERLETALFDAGAPYPTSAVWAFGIAAATQGSAGLYQYCRDNAPTNAVLRQHCFGYYEVLANNSNTMLGQAVGLRLQIELIGDDPLRSKQRADLIELRSSIDERNKVLNAEISEQERWISGDRSRFYAYINKWRATDELTAAEFSRRERQRHEANFNCTFVD